ncbi:hypothetical protein ACNQ2Q_26265, partial [Enterobacter cloacae complex sp.6701430]|uniref:hypothetical protein n=1 Tax=Enterobacter cloacae complex sp.6701430 TaxID=3397176 RepID=UPI003AAD7972
LIIGVTGLVNSKDISNHTESVTTTPEMLETAQKITIFGLSVTGIIILSLVVWLAFFTNKDRNDDSVQERKINVTTVPDTTLKDKGELQ